MNPDLLYTLDPITLSQLARALPREAIGVAMLFDGHRRLWEVVRDSALSGRMTLSVVNRLLGCGIIAETPREEAGQVVYPPCPTPVRAVTPWPAPKAIPSVSLDDAPAHDDAPSARSQTHAGDTQPLPRMVVVPSAEPAHSEAPTLRIDSALLAGAAIRPAPAPVRQGQTDAPAPAAASERPVSFDATDQAFFDSYVPEEAQVDTFWDLEDNPARRLRAKRRAQRIAQGGWLRQVLSLF